MTANGTGAEPEKIVALAQERGLTIATGESLTAGMVAAALAAVPGASAVLRGGVVSYHRDVKTSLLGVDAELLNRVGAVDPEVALQMARGAKEVCGADIGVATTGVAGPDPHEGKAVGTVVTAVVAAAVSLVQEYRFEGSRAQIREASSRAALDLLAMALEHYPVGTNGVPQ